MNHRGFTFIELMIILAIISILVTIALPQFQQSVIKAREATLKETLYILRDAIDQYYTDQGQYPPSFEALVENRYLRGIPKDPFTDSPETWVLVPTFDDSGGESGIFDVKSGSDRVALNGTPYKEW